MLSILRVLLKLGEWIDQLVLGFLVTEKKTVRSNYKEESGDVEVVDLGAWEAIFGVPVSTYFDSCPIYVEALTIPCGSW